MTQIRDDQGQNAEFVYQLTPQEEAKGGNHPAGVILMALGLFVALGILAASVYLIGPVLVNGLSVWIEGAGWQWPSSTSLGTGDIQVTLRWKSEADLDLRVVDPTGAEVSYETPQSASGGIFEMDANGSCEGAKSPVENIYWPTGVAPHGTYEVIGIYYQPCSQSASAVAYEVMITLDGEVVNVIEGEASVIGERYIVTSFEY